MESSTLNAPLLSQVVATLNVLPMVWLGDGLLKVIGELPTWASEEFSCFSQPNRPFHVAMFSPFLENFIIDAESLWQTDSSEFLRSGVWAESGKTGREVQLEAIAMTVGDRSVLLVESSDVATSDKFQWLQTAREEQLDRVSERKLASNELISARFYDGLTGLPNRDFFLPQLEKAYEDYTHKKIDAITLIKINLDGFQRLNNSLGNQTGDQVLIETAKRIQGCAHPTDILARFGADEFCLLRQNSTSANIVESTTHILNTIHQPLSLDQHTINISASAGICYAKTWYHNARDLLRDASLAVSHAKTLGKGHYAIFDRNMRSRAFELWNLESALEQALERGEFQMWYQPIVNARNNCIESFEALIRWHHPTYGWVSPSKFIPIAEKSGLVLQIDDWVLEQVCQALQRWQEAGKTNVHVNVNISARHFTEGSLLSAVEEAIASHHISPKSIRLEITESSLLEDVEAAIQTLEHIKSLGLEVAIDDFGTGYASLSYLQALPLDQLKIDGYFVEMMSTQGSKIVNTIIELAHDLGFFVTAERVETIEQYEVLKQLGCDTVQGYLFSQAIPEMDAQHIIGSEVIV